MQWRYGGYFWPANAVEYTTTKSALMTETGLPYAARVSVTLAGTFVGEGQKYFAAQQALMEAAVSASYRDLVLNCDDGSTAISLYNKLSLSGVRRTAGPVWDGTGAAYATYLSFSGLTFEADFPLSATAPTLLDFTETLAGEGGGAEYGFLRPLRARPVKQQQFLYSPYTAVQSGSSTSLLTHVIQPPLWPTLLMRPPSIRRTSKRMGFNVVHYQAQWEYQFGSADPLVGLPAVAPQF